MVLDGVSASSLDISGTIPTLPWRVGSLVSISAVSESRCKLVNL